MLVLSVSPLYNASKLRSVCSTTVAVRLLKYEGIQKQKIHWYELFISNQDVPIKTTHTTFQLSDSILKLLKNILLPGIQLFLLKSQRAFQKTQC